MSIWIKRLLLGSLIGLLGVLAILTPVGSQLEEDLGLSWLFHLRGAITAPREVVVVAIDKLSADQLGLPRTPSLWPRNLHARLIERLSKAGAQVIAFDLRFDTPSSVPEFDVELASAMSKAGNVVVVERLDSEESHLIIDRAGGSYSAGTMIKSAPLLPIIADAALAHAAFPLPRASRVNDYWAFKTSAGDAPTLPVVVLQLVALEAYKDFVHLLHNVNPLHAAQLPSNKNAVVVEDLILTLHGIFTEEPQIAQHMLLELGRDLRVNPRNKLLIQSLLSLYAGGDVRYLNFYGPPRTVQTVPYYQALQSTHRSVASDLTENDFEGKVVFVGFSAATQPEQDRIRDDYHTVFSQSDGLYISGVEIAATAFANLLEDRPIRPLSFAINLGAIFLWGCAIVIAYTALPHRTSIIRGTGFVLLSLGLIFIYVYIAYHQFINAGRWLPLIVPLCQVPVALFGAVLLQYYGVKREREILNKAFVKFVPERVVTEILKSAGPITTSNRLVYGTCLATDAEMYTTLSEQMNPAQLGVLMNDYYATMFEPVSRHGGIVSDVVGDAMLAIWATSSDDLLSRKDACLACLDIAAALEHFNQGEGRPPLHTRIGLHSGEMFLGTIGALHHYEYRAVGDMVNTTNRIQGLNKYLHTRVLVSDKVIEELDDFLARPVGSFLLAGRTSPVRIAELMARKQDASSEQIWLCEIFANAMRAYESQEWPGGCHNFSEILKAFPNDGPARFYLKRCQDYRETAPVGSWDASIRMEGK